MKILVIDDQKAVVEGLCEKLPEMGPEIDGIFGANSAAEAREILKKEAIDVMLCDIEMPGEDGLSLWSWVREEGMDTDCIFLTSHADFSYAQKALRLGSFEYILQPAPIKEIEEVLQRVLQERERKHRIQTLEKSSRMLKEKESILVDSAFERILGSGELEEAKTAEEIRKLCKKEYAEELFYMAGIQVTAWKKERWDDRLVKLVLANSLGELFENMDCEILLGRAEEKFFAVLIHGADQAPAEAHIMEGFQKMQAFVMENMDFETAVYLEGRVERNFQDTYKRLWNRKRNNVMEASGIFSQWIQRKPEKEKIIQRLHPERWEMMLEENMGENILTDVRNFCRTTQMEDSLDLDTLRFLHSLYTKSLLQVLEKKRISTEDFFRGEYTYDEFLASCYTCRAFENGIQKTAEILEHTKDEKEDRLEAVKEYLRENISKNVSRAEAAGAVYLNEEYFSRWFSKETGLSFKDYVIREKMDFARKLLRETNFSVSIVASKIGYDNFSYFSRMFRREEGMSPQEYRQKWKEET